MKTPSGYQVLDNRPIDQWKVTELREELKRRKLITKGLKEELVKRLDEAIRVESEAGGEEIDNGDNEPEPEAVEEVGQAEGTVVGGSETGIPVNAEENVDGDNGNISGVEAVSFQVDIEDSTEPNQEEAIEQKESDKVGDAPSVVVVDDQVCESFSSGTAMGGLELQDDKPERKNEESEVQQDSMDIERTHEDVKLDTSDQNNQVSEVDTNLGFPIKSNSVLTDSVSMCEKNELKDNIITDNVKLEPDVKPEMVQPSSSDVVPDGGKLHPKDVEKPLENQLSVGETKNNVTNQDIYQKNLSADLGSSEKLNLDRSSGDDSLAEDAFESKQIDSNYNFGEVGERTEKSDVTTLKEEAPFTAMDSDLPAEEKSTHSEDKDVVPSSDKRKLPDHEALNSEPSKRQRRWKSEGNNIGEPQISNIQSPVAAKDVPQPAAPRRNFSRSDSGGAIDILKEREVPPSTKAETNSLRVDNFLRPFTLKAVQELFAKTGTLTSFWMDHIKTHCYVTYSSVEEAVATRSAIYNLQWPPNGGRQLVAEFVDPKEVKVRMDPPLQPPSKPVITAPPATAPEPSGRLPQPSPHKIDLRQKLTKQFTLPPPPPLSNPALAREQFLPPPPPPEEKIEASILTLDDLFRKTKATPRIYYLPLSEEEVSAKLEAQQGNSRQQ